MYIAVVGNNGNFALVVCVCILSRSVCVVLCVRVCVSLDTKSDLYTTHTVLGDLVVVCTYIHTCTYVCCIWSEPYTGFSVMSWVVVITTPA